MDHLPTIRSSHPGARAERLADGVIHLTGVTLALIGCVVFVIFSALNATPAVVASVSIYAALLMFGLIASATYHLAPWDRFRPMLRRIDHAAIYLKIAGTYTPIAVLIGSAFAYGVLAAIWVLAVAGALKKLLFWAKPGRLDPLLYLALGWASVLLIWPVAQTLPSAAAVLIVIGGLLYSLGVIVFAREGQRYAMAAWHGMVLAASSCFFAAIAVGVGGTAVG